MIYEIGMPARFTWGASMILCLALGFGLGWWMHRTSPPIVEPASRTLTKPENSAVAATNDQAQQATVTVDETASAKAGGLTMAQRAAAIEWLKASGIPFGISPLGMMFQENKLNPVFVRLFDLTPAEIGRLEGSLVLAHSQYDATIRTKATGSLNSEGTQLSVHVPPSPEQGGAIHDSLLSAFEQVLGPERFQLFNVVSGDAFEQSFDSFGLGTVDYTMDLRPKVESNGFKTYEIKRITTNSDKTGFMSGNQLDLKTAMKEFPVLKRFIPPDLEQSAGK